MAVVPDSGLEAVDVDEDGSAAATLTKRVLDAFDGDPRRVVDDVPLSSLTDEVLYGTVSGVSFGDRRAPFCC